METKRLLKRIAAVTMAALTVMTSSNIDVNLLTANAAEKVEQPAAQSTEQTTSENKTTDTDSKSDAATKRSFTTDESLQRAVADAGFTIDVKTDKVTSAVLKDGETQLTLGKDFTADAKRTGVKNVESKYNYIYTITINGTGEFEGTAKRENVEQISDIAPDGTEDNSAKKQETKKTTVSKKSAPVKKSSVRKNAPVLKAASTTETEDPNKVFQATVTSVTTDKYLRYDTGEGWVFYFNQRFVNYDPEGKKQVARFGDGTRLNNGVTVYYKDEKGEEPLNGGGDDYSIEYGENTEAGESSGTFTVTSNLVGGSYFSTRTDDIASKPYAKKITVSFRILNSILKGSSGEGLKLIYNGQEHNVERTSNGNGKAEGEFVYNGNKVRPEIKYRNGTSNSGEPIWATLSEANQKIKIEYTYDNKTGTALIQTSIPSEGETYEKVNIKYTISARSITDNYNTDINSTTGITIQLSNADDLTYDGTSKEPKVTVTEKGESSDKDGTKTSHTLTEGTDYTVTYQNNTNAGTADVVVSAVENSNYTGSATVPFTIKPKEAVSGDIITDESKKDEGKLYITGLDSKYTGSELKPVPTIKYYVRKKGDDYDVLTLEQGKDFEVTSWTNNTNIAGSDAQNLPTAHICFKGNYTGEIDQTFSITLYDLSSAGTKVTVNSSSEKEVKNTRTGTGEVDFKDYTIDYSPIKSELPVIQIKDSNNRTLSCDKYNKKGDGDYSIAEEPTWAGSGTKQEWPSVGDWNLTITGEGNYSGTITVKFHVSPLDLSKSVSSGKLKIVNQGFDSNGKAYVEFSYKNTVSEYGKTIPYETEENIKATKEVKTGDTTETVTNFTIDPDTNEGLKASKNITLTLHGKGNYTGNLAVDGFKNGLNLADAAMTKDENTLNNAQIRIREFDPFTGAELTPSSNGVIAMPYYGDDIIPQFIVQIKEVNQEGGKTTTTWKRLDSEWFKSSDVSKQTNVGSTYVYRGTITLSAIESDQNTKVYGEKTVQFYVEQHSLSQTDSDGNVNKNILSSDIKANASKIASKTNLDDIGNGLELTLEPENANKYIYIPEDSSNDPKVHTSDVFNETKAGDALAYWRTPTISDNKLKYNTDFTVDFQRNADGRPINVGTIIATGRGNYAHDVIIKLGQDDLSNDDFFIRYNATDYTDNPAVLPGIDFDGNEHWPSVQLWRKQVAGQQSPTQLKEGIDYRVAYINPNGEMTDAKGYLINNDGDYVDLNNNKINTYGYTAIDEYGNLLKDGKYIGSDGYEINDSDVTLNKKDGNLYKGDTKVDNAKLVKSIHGFRQAGSYTIQLIGTATGSADKDKTATTTDTKSSDTAQTGTDTGSKSGDTATKTDDSQSMYFGTRTVTYTIAASTTPLTATFTQNGIVNYNYSSDEKKNNTLKPDFAYEEEKEEVPDGAIRLNVWAQGVAQPLVRSTDGVTGDYTVRSDDNLTEPGQKMVYITGINKYAGQSITTSYNVVVNMSEIGRSDGMLKATPDLSKEEADEKTLYYDGGTTLKTGKRQPFSQYVTIKTDGGNGNIVDDSNYTVSIDGQDDSITNLYSAGSHYIDYIGKGAYQGSYRRNINVVVTRANLLWTGDSTTKGNGTTSVTLPWKNDGYKLGQGALSLYKSVNGTVESVKLTDTDIITVDGIQSKQKNSDGTVSEDLLQKAWNEIGTHTVTIKGPLGSDDFTTLTFTILYDLSKVDINLGKEKSTPYNGTDVFFDSDNNKIDLSQIKVASGSQHLNYDTDYGIERKYTAGNDSKATGFKNAGTIEVSLTKKTGRSMYFDENTKPTASYTISRLMDGDKYFDISQKPITHLTYNGQRQEPKESDFDEKVSYSSAVFTDTLKYGTDYTVKYDSDSTNAGSKSVTITGIGNYGGSKTIKDAYEIDKADLSTIDAKNIHIPDQYFAGAENAITPKTLTIDGITGTLDFSTDYTISNPRNNNVLGTATININGTGDNFTGTASNVTFQIVKLDLSSETVKNNIEVSDTTYNKGASVGIDQHIKIFVPDGKGGDGRIQLQRGRDYTLTFISGTVSTSSDPTDAGTYDVQITAKDSSSYVKNQYTIKGFKVNALNIEDVADQFNVENAAWTGNPVTPKVTFNGSDLDSTYTVTYENNIDACAKTRAEMLQYNTSFDGNKIPQAVITGKGNYVGTIKRPFQIGMPFSDATITPTSNSKIIYNGNSQRREYTVSYTDASGNRQTVAAERYNVLYPTNTTDAGDKTVLFTANSGPLYGTKTVTYTIYPVTGSTWSIEFDTLTMDTTGQYTAQYNGAPVTPSVKAYRIIAGGTREEIPLKPSEITYKNNEAPGVATVSVSPTNYEGTKTLNFRILGLDISGDEFYAAFTDGVTRLKYTGSEIKPPVIVTYTGSQGTVTLTEDRDYSLTYENNINAGTADVKVNGIGNNIGTRTLTFDIYADFNDATSVFTIPKQMYTGKPITSLMRTTLQAGGNDLKLTDDYTLNIISTDSFKTSGTAIFTSQGKYYEGTRRVQFEIGTVDLNYTVQGVESSYVFDHTAHKPVPTVIDDYGNSYTVENVNYASTSDGGACIDAGTVQMEITISNNGHPVTIPYSYTIEQRNINTATMSQVADVDYTGTAQTPTVSISDGKNQLKSSNSTNDGSADYAVTYTNNVKPGVAKVTVKGINNYNGESNLYFQIKVKTAPKFIVTAMPNGRIKVTWKKVSGASGYRVFYSKAKSSQKQKNLGSKTTSTYLTGLKRGVVYKIGIQSYVKNNGKKIYSKSTTKSIATSTSQPKIKTAKSTGKGKIKITWSKVKNATGYMVYRRNQGSKKWKKVKTTKSTSFTNTKLKRGRKYYYKVVSYKQYDKTKRSYSKYSKTRTVKSK